MTQRVTAAARTVQGDVTLAWQKDLHSCGNDECACLARVVDLRSRGHVAELEATLLVEGVDRLREHLLLRAPSALNERDHLHQGVEVVLDVSGCHRLHADPVLREREELARARLTAMATMAGAGIACLHLQPDRQSIKQSHSVTMNAEQQFVWLSLSRDTD